MTTTQTETEARARAKIRPFIDVFETPEALVLIADVPGADEESIELALDGDVLTLHARPRDVLPDGWKPVGAELALPDYERDFRLAADIERDSISASLQNGRLRVVLKKRQPNRIAVKAG